MKAKRDNAAVEAALADLEAACKDENEKSYASYPRCR